MKQIIIGGNASSLSNTDTLYQSVHGTGYGISWASYSTWRYVLSPLDATIKNFRVTLDSAPGAGTSYKFDVLTDSYVVIATVTISDTETTARCFRWVYF